MRLPWRNSSHFLLIARSLDLGTFDVSSGSFVVVLLEGDQLQE
jgi:hypothetical protein